MKTIWTELKEWKRDWPLLVFGLFAAPIDGVVIAQVYDWINAGHRLSTWVLL